MRCISNGNVIVSFAVGMIVAALFPYTLAVIVIAAVLIVAGLSLCRF